jgi:hypothetical protein
MWWLFLLFFSFGSSTITTLELSLAHLLNKDASYSLPPDASFLNHPDLLQKDACFIFLDSLADSLLSYSTVMSFTPKLPPPSLSKDVLPPMDDFNPNDDQDARFLSEYSFLSSYQPKKHALVLFESLSLFTDLTKRSKAKALFDKLLSEKYSSNTFILYLKPFEHQLQKMLVLQKRDPPTLGSNTSSLCPATVEACQSTFNNCSYHGSCMAFPNPLGKKNSTCYFCKCTGKVLTDDNGKPIPGSSTNVKWAGDSCEFQDISVSFQILFWITVGLLILIISVIGMMFKVDQGDSFTGNPFEHRLKQE